MQWIDYKEALTRGLWLIAVLAIAGAAIGFLLPKGVVQPVYSTTTSVGAAPSVQGANSAIPPGVTTDQVIYYADQDSTFARANSLAQLNETQATLRAYVRVEGPCGNCNPASGTPGIVQIIVRAPTKVESAALNVAFDNALESAVNDGAKALNNGQPVTTGFEILQTTQPDFASQTKTTVQTLDSRPVRAAAGLLIGLILGMLIAVAMALLGKRVTSARRAQTAMGYPVVAEIPPNTSTSQSNEAYRMLWLSVFREPLPEPEEPGGQWLDDADLMADAGSWRGVES